MIMLPFETLPLEKIRQLCRQHQVATLYAFGSILTTQFRSDSDIDLLVQFGEMDLLAYADNYFSLQEKLEALLGKRVDLVIEKDLTNPVLIKNIYANRQLLYPGENSQVAA